MPISCPHSSPEEAQLASSIERTINFCGDNGIDVYEFCIADMKHGTEMLAYSGKSPFLTKTFDRDSRLFGTRDASAPFYPLWDWSMSLSPTALAVI
jgi:hypothetical protein